MPRILLFGTSGNPPTGRDGHSGMVDYFVTLGVSASDDPDAVCFSHPAIPIKNARRRWQSVLLPSLLMLPVLLLLLHVNCRKCPV